MYIVIAAISTVLSAMLVGALGLEGMSWDLLVAIVVMGCFILFDNRKRK